LLRRIRRSPAMVQTAADASTIEAEGGVVVPSGDVVGGGRAVAASIWTPTVTITDVPTLDVIAKEVACVPTGRLDVWNDRVTFPVFVPVVGETMSQLAVGPMTDHFSARFPVFSTRTLAGDGFVPAYPWTLTIVGLTDKTGCAAANVGSAVNTSKKLYAPDRVKRGMLCGS
jgi:hypothetical protein